MSMPAYPSYPGQQPGLGRPKRRTGLIVAVCVIVAVVLGAGAFVAVRLLGNGTGGGPEANAAPPPGFTELPASCDLLSPEEVQQSVPGAKAGQVRLEQDQDWGLTRDCQWGLWDDQAGVGRSLEINVTAGLDPVAAVRGRGHIPLPATTDDVRGPLTAGGAQVRPTTVAGADEAYLQEPQRFGVPDLNEHVTEELAARYQNIVLIVTYDPGEVVDDGKLAEVLTRGAEQALATIKETPSH
ncbi:hypothetical protein [Amycolatopsis taiwanensis]|uniref:DUF3558 domain-containing protein n=1 Tax=Amycolatopsis taiwanensis TaxID=342230 RepID=A0A9W6R3I0_9PSEU|nr:hypothetical protein [Amycolatopsis taiwanensis]GLY66820.1 hypothetical protein Atai01_34390 [Amycolatopsis taiwanensis]